MRILWLCNVVLPELCEEFGFKTTNVGGWLTGMWSALKKQSEMELGICAPIYNKERAKDGFRENYAYYSFLYYSGQEYLSNQIDRFCEIIEEFQPEVIHIWGTEYLHSYAMVLAAEMEGLSDRVAINIQGLVSVCALHYGNFLPEAIIAEEWEGSSIRKEIEDFKQKGILEKKCLQQAAYVIGRTEWDKACAKQIAPNTTYLFCNEILRRTFYENVGSWSYKACEPHTIFISQASYPIKGFHIFLNGLELIKEKYPDVKVYVAGDNLLEKNSVYARYIRSEIRNKGLEEQIQFLGMVSEQEMCCHYQKCNVFVSASVIENSPNSVCEAAIIGAPVVSSFVGGVGNLITNAKEGYLYPADEFYMMAYYVCELFENKDDICKRLSEKSVQKMEKINSVEKNSQRALEIYRQIVG